MLFFSNFMRGFRKLCQRESNSDNVFSVDGWRDDPNTTKTGHCRLAMAFHWRADDGLTLNAD